MHLQQENYFFGVGHFSGTGRVALARSKLLSDDGNKRTSLVIGELFLNLNGIELTASDEAVVVTWMQLAAGQIFEEELEVWIMNDSRRVPKPKRVGEKCAKSWGFETHRWPGASFGNDP